MVSRKVPYMRMQRLAPLLLAPLLLAGCEQGLAPLQRQPPAPPPNVNTYNINPALRPPKNELPINSYALNPIPADNSRPAAAVPSATPAPPPLAAPAVTPLQSVAATPTPSPATVPAMQTPPPAAAQSGSGEDQLPTKNEVESLYEGVMLTYSFDACGMPLLGSVARQDISQRIEICPNTERRKSAFRTVYERAISDAENDPVKTHVNALALCPDKKAFLQKVMSHANELKFDDSKPPDCGLLEPHP
ncbi:MAG TPA: hypothetical protein VMC10_07675 [Stellaceae bacterium]|nr:hypothetical protein [Stellaceae bacterium]